MTRLILILRDYRFWVILLLFAVFICLHYPQQVLCLKSNAGSLLGLERHAVERFLFLIPIILGGVFFGLRGGMASLVAAFTIMLPRAFLLSPSPKDALTETGVVVLAGALVVWWINSRQQQIGQREQALLRLEAVRRELNSYIKTIRENEKRLSALHSVATILNQSVTLEEIFSTVADKIREVVNIEIVLIYLINEKTHQLDVKLYRGASEEFARQVDHLAIGEGFNGWVAQTGEACWIEDSVQDPRLTREVVEKEGIRSLYVVPLKSREKIVGTLCVAVHSIRHFTAEERELLILIGTELGVAVEKARLFEESERSGKRFRELFEKAHDAIWVHDFDGKILTANRQCSRLFGYEGEDINGEDVSRFLTHQGLKLASEVKHALLAGEEISQPYEQIIMKKDGTEAITMLTTSLLDYEGVPAFQNIARDVTRERQLQENLRTYVDQITRAHEEERKRIARDLHDDTIQALVVLSQRIENLVSSELGLVGTMAQLEDIQKEVDELQSGIRRFIQDLRPPTLEYLGLLPAVRELVSQLRQQADVNAELIVTGTEKHFTPEDELLIYRIVQEALQNIRKHAEAKKVEATIDFGKNKTTIAVSDDGTGFDVEADPGFVQAGKIGLAGMQERVRLLDANLAIHSKPGQGTKVILEIPRERWKE
ncbi:PAS domain S-box protein [Chloroflexota bacterium]